MLSISSMLWVHSCTHTHANKYIYIRTYIHTYIHTYTHQTQMLGSIICMGRYSLFISISPSLPLSCSLALLLSCSPFISLTATTRQQHDDDNNITLIHIHTPTVVLPRATRALTRTTHAHILMPWPSQGLWPA